MGAGEAVDPPAQDAPAKSRHSWLRRAAPTVVAAALVVAIFVFVLPRIADYGAVLSAIGSLSWQQSLLLAGVTALNVVTYAPPLMAALPGISFLRALVVTQASTASTYIAPGGAAVGIAVSFGMLRAWGFGTSAVALAVTVTGVFNQLFLLACPAIALMLLTFVGGSNALLVTVAVIGGIVFAIAVGAFAAALASEQLARRVGDAAARITSKVLGLVRRGPVGWNGDSLVTFRREAIGLLRARWWLLALATIAGQGTVFLVLLATLRVVGISSSEVSAIEAFASWSIVRLLGSLPVTPGGIGIVELGLTGALVGFGGKSSEVVAAVLLYRALTMLPTLILGGIAAFVWKRMGRARAQESMA